MKKLVMSSLICLGALLPTQSMADGLLGGLVVDVNLGIFDKPRVHDHRPCYYKNNRYYYGGEYRDGAYHYRGRTLRGGHYYERGYEEHYTKRTYEKSFDRYERSGRVDHYRERNHRDKESGYYSQNSHRSEKFRSEREHRSERAYHQSERHSDHWARDEHKTYRNYQVEGYLR